MTADAKSRSLFSRLLSNRASRASKEGYKGHEEYLTQIMAYMLETDPDLAKLWLRKWFRIEGAHSIEIVAEDSSDSNAHPDLPSSTIDVRVSCLDSEGTAHRVYVENKVEAKLNLYKTGDGEVEDQVEKYKTLLERVCTKSGEQGHIIVCGLRPQARLDPALAPRVQWHEPKYWWDLAVMVRDHVAASPDAAWVQRAFVDFCEEQGLMPLEALRQDTITAEQARRLLGLGALAANAKNIKTTSKPPDGDAAYPWTATVYFTPEKPRVADRPKYWISLSKEAEDAHVVSRAYWEKVCELGTPFADDLWALEAEQQQDRVKEAVEGAQGRMDYLEPVLALHDGKAARTARLVAEHIWGRNDAWLVAGKNEIRVCCEAWPRDLSIKINRYEGTGSELVLALPKNLAVPARLGHTATISGWFGVPTRRTHAPTRYYYTLELDQQAASTLVAGVAKMIDLFKDEGDTA